MTYADAPDDLPSGEGTWIKVYLPTGPRWERIDKHGRTEEIWSKAAEGEGS